MLAPRKNAALALTALVMAGAPMLVRAQAMPNPYGATVTTEVAKKAAAAALAEARKNGWVVYATVVDRGGAVAYVERIDGVQFGSADVSMEKARTAVAFKRPSKVFEDLVLEDMNFSRAKDEEILTGLLGDRNDDLYIQIFYFTDRIGHLFWRFLDPGHPAYDPEIGRAHV